MGGWPDYGLKCLKVGNIRTGIPTVWQPGDEEYLAENTPTSYYNEHDTIAHRAQHDGQQNMDVHKGSETQGQSVEYITEYVTEEVPVEGGEQTTEYVTEEVPVEGEGMARR